MPDYEKMYALLCAAIDDAIAPLEQITAAQPIAERLVAALNAAEDIYIDTAE